MKFLITMFFFGFVAHSFAQPGLRSNENKKQWWFIEKITPFIKKFPNAEKLSEIKVVGNAFVNEKGQKIVFKGVSISDPDKIVKDGHWNKHHFEVIKSWGATLIRIPVHPISVHQRGIESYVELLDQAVNWCTELGIYVIIDWHSIGNLYMEILSQDMHNTTKKETFNFWRTIAEHFKGVPTVAFYELFNEPTTAGGRYGKCDWKDWKNLMEQIIDVIRVHNDKAIALVAGFNWAYDLTPVRYAPIARKNIAYVTHPYPGKRKFPWVNDWERDFGFVADNYPVIATEIGFSKDSHEDANLQDDGKYGPVIMNYFHKKGISWTAWVFDPVWEPKMIESWNYEPSEQGAFFRDVMLGKFKYQP